MQSIVRLVDNSLANIVGSEESLNDVYLLLLFTPRVKVRAIQ
jgi:hypothetical protein